MNEAHFLATYLPLRSSVLEVCRILLGSSEDAEDVAQDLYIQLWQQRQNLREVRSPRTYVITLARNRCLDRLRSAEYKLKDSTDISLLAGSATEEDPQSILVAQEESERLAQWVARLPRQQQEIFRLRHYDMLTNPEIAEKLHLQEPTVRSIVSRLRKEARQLFASTRE